MSRKTQKLLPIVASNFLRGCLEVFREHLRKTHNPVESERVELYLLPSRSLKEYFNSKCREYTGCYQYPPTDYFYTSLTLHGFKTFLYGLMGEVHDFGVLHSRSFNKPFVLRVQKINTIYSDLWKRWRFTSRISNGAASCRQGVSRPLQTRCP